ncbi:protein-disulfide reductase DsbD domain-containing protein [Psychrobacter sp. H8-1]|uniref:cytochrome c biogenesis protein CcdA n=1 Tax=Psychrobacter sp. H8-1 TaxID=2774129 RepID=UPI001919F940|nr:protein-disulfide reductase DsbD domain-containing protein [Psychrobacter sp. H8-1]
MSNMTSKKNPNKKSSIWALALVSTSLMLGLTTTATTAQAVSLGDLFGNNQSSAQKFLPVGEAFQVGHTTQSTAEGTRLAINFDITPEHYVYKDKIMLSLPDGVSAAPFAFSQTAVTIDDPTFGQVPVFDQTNVVATTTLTSASGKAIENAALTIGWQGCAKAGLCYPPEKIKTTISVAAPSKASAANSSATAATSTSTQSQALQEASANDDANNEVIGDDGLERAAVDNDVMDSDVIDYDALEGDATATNSISGADATTDDAVVNSNNSGATDGSSGLVDGDPFGLASHPWLALGLLFLAGLGLALTPCVLPMLPIVANIVARQQNPTVKKGVILTTSYAIGVATAYGMLGALIAVFGESLGIIGWLQNPIILISFAIVFVLLALYMLGVFTIRLPHAMSSKMQGLSQAGDSKLGSTGGSLVAGFLSALVVSPCVSAPLFGALLAVSTIGSPLLGFAALFMLGFGLSVPLIIIGATQGKIMPKAGEWMNWVKLGFALLLFAVALLLVERVFISPVMLLVWALWFMVVATWAWSWLGKGRMLTQALALVAGIWAAMLIVGAALGNDDSLHPLASLSAAPMMMQSADGQALGNSSASDEYITTLAELDAIVADNPKVIVDLTADWCVECRIMDKNLFHNRPAQMQGWQLVRLDITDTTEDSKAVLSRYKLFGPPALMYYQDGQLVNQQVGEIGRSEFEQTLTALNQ